MRVRRTRSSFADLARGELPFRRTLGNLSNMDYREFRRLRDGGISNLPPAAAAVLDAAASRLRRRLTSSAMFAEVTVETTDDAERLLIAGVHYRPGTPVKQVSSYLEAVWISELRLPGLDAFAFHVEDGHVELESFTGDKDSGYFLTLHLLAEQGTAQEFADPAVPAEGAKRRWFRR
jgi:hypothetical protein